MIHNYCPHADAFFPASAGTFVYGTYFLRSWALPAPVSYRSVIAGANFFLLGLPDGAVDSGAIGDGSSLAPAPGFVRVCAKCGQLSYFRERCFFEPPMRTLFVLVKFSAHSSLMSTKLLHLWVYILPQGGSVYAYQL